MVTADRRRLGQVRGGGLRSVARIGSRIGRLRDDRLRADLGADPRIDSPDHLPGTTDPASLRGAFGNEHRGQTPLGRWQITRADLFCAQAVGY